MLFTESVSYLPNREAYEVQTLYTDRAQTTPISTTSAVISEVKGQGRDAMWCV